MNKFTKYIAKTNSFKNFLNLSVEEGPTAIQEWIRQNILTKEEKLDSSTIKAFFQAEQELIQDYLKTNRMDKLYILVQQFTSIKNTNITKCELVLLEEILTKESDFLSSHPDETQGLAKTLATFKGFVVESTDIETQEIWNGIIRTHVGDFIEDNVT